MFKTTLAFFGAKGIDKKVAYLRLLWHAKMTSVVNVANQMHVLDNDRADAKNLEHFHIIIDDILPRLGYSKEAIEAMIDSHEKDS